MALAGSQMDKLMVEINSSLDFISISNKERSIHLTFNEEAGEKAIAQKLDSPDSHLFLKLFYQALVAISPHHSVSKIKFHS